MEQKPTSPSNIPDKERFAVPIDVTKKDRFAVVKAYFKKRPPKKRLAIISGVSVGILLAGAVGASTLIKDGTVLQPEPVVESTYVAPEMKLYSKLTGRESSEELLKRPVTGVMIENSVDARPQAGLEEAGVVFEAIAEGGITRFLALYQEEQPGRIGPVRSARPYYVQWAAGFSAAYAHSGGSPVALALIRSLGVKDLDHGNYDTYFERVSNRYAPHNVYTDMNRLDSLKNDLGFTASDYTGFSRILPTTETDTEEVIADTRVGASAIVFNISSPLYNTSYTYDAATKTYPRVMADRPHVDEVSSKQIAPSVVIGLVTEYGIDPNGIHSVYRTTGTGKALVFQEGTVVEATWSKASETASLQFTNAAGEPLQLVPGQTWITAVPDGRITYTP
jgi:hypothetical protein